MYVLQRECDDEWVRLYIWMLNYEALDLVENPTGCSGWPLSHVVERLLGQFADLLPVVLWVVSVLLSRVDVCRRVDVWLVEHQHDWEDDLLNWASRVPPLVCLLLLIELVGARRVQDRDTDLAIREDYTSERLASYIEGMKRERGMAESILTIGVPHFSLEAHLRGVVREVSREGQQSLEVPALKVVW